MPSRNARELKELRRPVSVVGLTGGIASGKTVATDALRASGYTVIDADEVSRVLTEKGGEVEKKIIEAFPEAAENGSLDRKKLRAIISRDKSAKKKLENLTHPIITEKIERALHEVKPPVILSAPLLFESALSALCDCVVCTVCPREERIKRICARDGVTELDAKSIIDAQIPDCERAVLADFCIPSDIALDEFKTEVVELFNNIFA